MAQEQTMNGRAAPAKMARYAMFAGVVLLSAGVANWHSHKSTLTDLAQSIMDDNIPSNSIVVDHLSMPVFLAVPLSEYAINEFGGYFSIASKDGEVLSQNCEFQTIDYTARNTSGGRIVMNIDGPGMLTLAACQP